ncbi:hypothetical protein GGR21_001832 [Dysgonomonas hofstadii]|uniref:DUF2029 domain-containing protein n=1 Tax=Dysgonomonas hofstadii TaxID=637886 RepID=A0A840CIR3_9BACT|nr:glycosyltransferase family 87 protein [Dysgonomonas hofstadii]MBB4035937.1 hypothetical protein [Dysgonomonas hofstadii]
MNAILTFFQKPIFRDKRFIMSIWFLIPLLAGIKHITRGIGNNYYIFKYSYYHLIEQVNLYAQYPGQHNDSNHYGPIFSLVIAPFALLPDNIGSLLWELAIATTLFIAIYKLPIQWMAKVIIFWICMEPLYTNALNSQTNTMIAAFVIGAFIFIRKENDFWATCLIALGFFIKLYGIVGLAFFFFSKQKIKFIGYFLFWCAVFFALPMLFSSPEFVIQSYADWYESLTGKNSDNITSIMQNISASGMIQRIFGHDISSITIIVPAILLFALQYLRTDMYNDTRYQLALLASTLMFIVLFSSGSESCTYIIATAGFGIWFIIQEKPYSKYVIFLLVFMIVLSLLGASDLAPSYVKREIVRKYALKSLPFLITWLTLIYQILKMKKAPETQFSSVYIEKGEGV